MEVIKFRGWDNKYKRWASSALTIIDRYHTALPSVELTRYTGLLDSEAAEEYFGDIIEENDGTRRVIEDEASFVAFRIVGGKDVKYFWDLLPHKVISNIYELVNDDSDTGSKS